MNLTCHQWWRIDVRNFFSFSCSPRAPGEVNDLERNIGLFSEASLEGFQSFVVGFLFFYFSTTCYQSLMPHPSSLLGIKCVGATFCLWQNSEWRELILGFDECSWEVYKSSLTHKSPTFGTLSARQVCHRIQREGSEGAEGGQKCGAGGWQEHPLSSCWFPSRAPFGGSCAYAWARWFGRSGMRGVKRVHHR